jgi:hypothetical protein
MSWARVAEVVFDVNAVRGRWDVGLAALSICTWFLASCAVIAWRVRRMEAVR